MRRACLALCLLLAVGCHWIYPFGSSSGPGDGDHGLADGADGAALDLESVEGHLGEAGLLDRGPRDRGPRDRRAEGPMSKDGSGKDAAKGDGLGSSPCAAAATAASPVVGWQTTMRICSGLGTKQCQAEQTLCNKIGGWSLCTATQYLGRGGDKVWPGTYTAWIKGCVRSGGLPHAPADTLCPGSTCLLTGGSTAYDVMWQCKTGSNPVSWTAPFLGLITSMTCHRVGANTTATEGVWFPIADNQVYYSAVCCK